MARTLLFSRSLCMFPEDPRVSWSTFPRTEESHRASHFLEHHWSSELHGSIVPGWVDDMCVPANSQLASLGVWTSDECRRQPGILFLNHEKRNGMFIPGDRARFQDTLSPWYSDPYPQTGLCGDTCNMYFHSLVACTFLTSLLNADLFMVE